MKPRFFRLRRKPGATADVISPPALETLERRVLLDGDGFNWGSIFDIPLVQDFLSAGGDQAENKSDDKDDKGGDDKKDEEKDEDKDKDEGEDKGGGKGKKVDAAPAANISLGDVSARSAAPHTITIVYTDDNKVKAKSIGVDDIVVSAATGPALTVTGVSISPDKDKDRIVATYRLAAPGGRWDAADNGTYTVTLKAAEVFDNKSHAAASVTANFHVSVVADDTAAPTATISVDNISTAGKSTHKATVTYTDNVGIDPTSIGPNDLTITGPGGAERPVRTVSVDSSDDGATITATYIFDAAGAKWDASDNGTYEVSLNDNQVRDEGGNGATASDVKFTVNVPRPAPIDTGFGGGSGGGSTDSGSGGSVGGGGVTTTFIAEAVVAQADGKILVAGRQGSLANGTSQGVIQRFNADGSLDTTFATKGKVVTAAGENDAFYAIALGDGGAIFVTGARGGDVLVSKYTPAGSLDTSFSQDGSATAEFGSAADVAYALGVAPDGSVVVAGGPGDNFAIAKFLPSGILDPNFSQGGVQMFDLGGSDDTPGAVAFQGSSIVVVGTSAGKVAVVRLRSNGEADETFSGDGLLLLDGLAARAGDANFTDRTTAAAVQPDGKLLLANRSTNGDFAIARLNANGELDSSFSGDGVQTVDFGGDDDADAVLVQDTGEILVIGTTNAGGNPTTAVAALDSSGELITDFGAGGKLTLTTDTSSASSARVLHIGDLVLRAFGTRQPDGRVVVGTASSSGTITTGGSGAPVSGGDNNSGGSAGAPITNGSTLRRLNVPGTRSQPLGTQLGTFGVANGKRSTLTVIDSDGTKVIFAASRGAGVVYELGGRYNLMLSDGPQGVAATIRTAGGDGSTQLGDVTVTGTLRNLTARTSDLSGTLYASGSIMKLCLGVVTGTVAAAGAITSSTFASLRGAKLMSGTGFGADAKLGGTAANADSYGAGYIGTVRVAGGIEASTISAGLDPGDGVFYNADDHVVGGETSVIRTVNARSADATSRFIAGRIVSLRLPTTTDLASDPRVKLMA